ncbi:hypothetical protein [Amycolatopsis alkalitolerans]|uniref:PPE domain-containing protein n=1 Tax=Amycolatopsis alkalitolerans TaxID=2547244 RepID=A0A5C4M3P7_9PSEU|nr:hypothetical protein [Amycolatopsis alkalitolerans]TNC26088.1 hypothetical protein FG385_13035 [Amycolatopsis alkalitolerans]
MSTFDSSRYDVPTLVEKLRDQRFDGYDPESLALEVERFREGSGTANMGDAVEALKQIAGALSHTDTTLREQLGALGVSWQSQAGGQASAAVSGQAGFSADANTKVAQAAELIFEQGEAFNRTKNKLPEPDALRQGEGGYTLADTLFSLFGFETDHAASVKTGIEAKAQAVDALNAYAHDSGEYLAASQPVAEPQSMLASPGAAVGSVAGPTIEPVPPAPEVPEVPDTSPTVAASAKDAPVQTSPVTAAAPSANAPTGLPVSAHQTGAGATAPSQATVPSTVAAPAPAPVTEPITAVVGGSQRPGQQERTSQPETAARPSGPGPVAPPAPGQQVGVGGGGVVSATPGGEKSAAAPGKPGGVPAEGAGHALRTGGERLLAEGKSFGAVAGGGSAPANVGLGLGSVRAVGGAGALAEGAPAIGAAGVGGVTSGEPERDRPARGSAPKGARPLPIGDLPEEEEALRARKAAPEPPTGHRTRAILEPAATQDGEEDGHHVRRYGVDDRDLFTDPREVSTDLIGGKPLPEE